MEELFKYSLLSALCLSVLYLVYLIYQIRERRFGRLRFFLLAIMFFSLVIPLIHIDFDFSFFSNITSEQVEFPLISIANAEAELMPLSSGCFEASETRTPVDWKNIFTLVYLIGIIFFFSRLVFQLLGIIRLSMQAEKRREGRYIIVSSKSLNRAFTFFNFIFIPECELMSTDSETILLHEKAHALQMHSMDILIMESLSSLLWFNPLVWLMKRSLQTVHEYLADEAVLSEGEDRLAYQALLLNQVAEGHIFSLGSAFSYSLIKKRIVMMNSTQSTWRINPAGFLLLIVIPILMITVSCTDNDVKELDNDIFTVVIDAGHGGTDPGATNGDVTESDLVLSMANIMKKNSSEGIRLLFTRSTDNYVELWKRVAFCQEVEADLYISLHINITKPDKFSGIQCFTGRETAFQERSDQFGGLMLDHFQTLHGIKTNKRIVHAPFLTLNKNSICPSVLISIGNLANPEDLSFITNENNQQVICNKILNAIEEYKAL